MTAVIKHSAHQNDLANAAIAKLKLHFGDRLTTAAAVRDQQGRDVSWHPSYPPDAVIFPETADEVSRIVATCHAFDVPVIPFGTGTLCEGHVAAPMGGICVDLSRLDQILMVQPDDMTATVEVGVTRKRLNAELRDTGPFFPVDPRADASLGGMASTCASGTNAVRYGTMKDNVISLGLVLPNGDRIRTASHARKSAAGYDHTALGGNRRHARHRDRGDRQAASNSRPRRCDFGKLLDARTGGRFRACCDEANRYFSTHRTAR